MRYIWNNQTNCCKIPFQPSWTFHIQHFVHKDMNRPPIMVIWGAISEFKCEPKSCLCYWVFGNHMQTAVITHNFLIWQRMAKLQWGHTSVMASQMSCQLLFCSTLCCCWISALLALCARNPPLNPRTKGQWCGNPFRVMTSTYRKIGIISCFASSWQFNHRVSQRRRMASYVLVNIGSSNDLLPDGTNTVPEPTLTNHQFGLLAFTRGKLRRKH